MDCRLGTVVGNRPVLRPTPGTFFSVDALNPDVVFGRGRWHLFFSGNDVHAPAGDWRTGLATAARPQGPYHVRSEWHGRFFNGGTVVWRGRFWQATQDLVHGNVLMTSSNGTHWRRIGRLPDLSAQGFPLVADPSLERLRDGLRLYVLVRRATTGLGGSIASVDWRHGRWSNFRLLLSPSKQRWESTDLGEPAAFRVAGVRYLLYVGTAPDSVRSIGLAREVAGGRFRRCGTHPFIAPGATWGPSVAIDPSPVVNHRTLRVFYGGGTGTSIAADLRGTIGMQTYRLPPH